MFEDRLLRRIFGYKRKEVTETGENFLLRIFII
jgi:hypothetical protein